MKIKYWIYAHEDNGNYNCQGTESLREAEKSFNGFKECKQHGFEGYKSVYIFKVRDGEADFRHAIRQWNRK